jgi:DNA repair exonuclease SbcCD ATPase subunit
VIPHRIKMTGFLSYKDEQEVRFDGAPLWMLAGTNGSGKSSIFDGVTYALFGHHRGGSQNAIELINKESASLSVEFDYKLDGELYRIKRTLRKNARGVASGTQQIFHHVGSAIGNESGWEPVPDTGKKVDFDKWIHDMIGLNYETFTSSVLLLQGKAEKLLDARPSGRAEVLASIVDLERYQRLHEKANTQKLELKSKLDALSHQSQAVPDVSDMEYAAALNVIDEREETRQQARVKIDALLALEAQARRWSDTQTRLAAARQKLTHVEALLGEAVKIEKAFARLVELRDVLPAVNTIASMRGQLAESQRKTDKLLKDREETQERKLRAEAANEQAKKKRASVQKQLAEDEAKHTAVNARLRELAGLLEKVRLAEQQESDLRRLEEDLSRLPADPEEALRTAQERVEQLTELNRVLPILERFGTERFDLADAQRKEHAAKQEQEKIRQDGERQKAEAAKLQPEVERAKQARATADQQAAVARAMVEQARLAADEFATLAGAKTCRACGQPLTEKHFAEEKAKRERDAKTADQRHRDAIDTQTRAAERERELVTREAELNEQLVSLRVAYKEQNGHVDQAAKDIKRLTDSLALRYAEMPKPYQSRIAAAPLADWTRTSFPERDELISLRREVDHLSAAKRSQREASDTLTKVHQLRARVESGRQTLTRLRAGLPSADLAALRQDHQERQAEETALVNAIKAAKQNVMQLDTEADKFGRDAHTAIQILTDIEGKLRTEQVSRQLCTDSVERAKKNLPQAWLAAVENAGMADYSAWRSEYESLSADGTESKYKQLEQARGGLNALRQEITELEAEADAFAPDSRRAPEEVKALLAAARQESDARDKDLRDAQQQKALLDSYREQRAKLGEQQTRTEGLFNRYKILAELLGRDRLQRHLVRQAERQIVDYGNAVLDRLSGGQLFLKLVGDDGTGADRALDLECYNRVTGGAPINVAFLSGSQRFRVAVALALAIGQYASRQHRPIESVIIDEGFGCLDRQGRQVMIQELQNLRGHLHCILLVSHQEEFADAFPDGYRFELVEGRTQVQRFNR